MSEWILVPKEPTEAMWQAGREADEHPGDSYTKVWCAMAAAAPEVEQLDEYQKGYTDGCAAAAHEIKRLEAELAALSKAVRGVD